MATVVKATFNLPDAEIDALRRLAAERRTTVTATVRRAIATEGYLSRLFAEGGRLLVEKPDGSIKQVVVLGT